jgi:toxin ParE1/3/4
MSAPKRELSITPAAREDIEQVLAYSEEVWGLEQSDRYENRLYERLQRLRTSPERGRSRQELADGLRSVLADHHLIYYTHDDQAVIVHRILHERRQVTGEMFLPESGE